MPTAKNMQNICPNIPRQGNPITLPEFLKGNSLHPQLKDV